LRSRNERGPDEARTAVPKREAFEREREENLMSSPDDDRGLTVARDSSGRRSTVAFGREVVAAALEPVSPAAAVATRAERDCRRGYLRHLRSLVEASVVDAAAPLAVARAGLAAVAARLRFVGDGGESSLAEAMAAPRRDLLRTRSVRGRDSAPEPLAVPYRGRMLAGESLLRQLDDWVARDLVEPSFAEALRQVHDHPDWLDLADQTFVLLGAGAEMGPFDFLVKRRAQIVAVDLARPAIWQRLIAATRAGNGTLHLPTRGAGDDSDDALAQRSGADLLTETPEIAAWIGSFDLPLTVGAYAYLDGVLHLRVAAAMDAIQAAAAARQDVTLAMLGTPTDVAVVPAETMAAAHERHAQRPLARQLWQQPLHWISGGRLFARNIEPTEAGLGIVDALVVQQGPNYALAKRLQQWRALAARADGHCVSARVAPPSLTGSVLSNPLMGAAYRSAAMFGVEAFEPATASVLMAALLVHDLRNPRSAARPATPLAQPLLLFADAAHHGGLWRSPFAARSALPVAALTGYLRRGAPHRS